MVNQRSRKPGRKAPPRVEDIAAGNSPADAAPEAPETSAAPTDEATDAADEAKARSVDADSNPGDATVEAAELAAESTDTSEEGESFATSATDGEADEVTATSATESDTDATASDTDATPSDARDPTPDANAPSIDAGDTTPDTPSNDVVDAAPDTSSTDADDAAPDASPASDDADTAPAADPDDPLAAVLAGFDAPRPAAPGVQLSEEIPIDPEDDLRAVEGEASLRLVSILESLLFAAAKPLRVQDLRKVLAETSKHQIQLALKHLMRITSERGVVLAQVAGGFQFRTHPDNAVWVQKMLQSKPARLSRTQIETLAIVAYRQPITRPEIDDVRGVDSGAVLKTLLERELIQIVGKKEEPGRPLLYGTTVRFLEFFNLRGLRDLPTLRDFRDLSEESKATLRAKLGETENEAEAMGQGVLGLDAEDGASDMSETPDSDGEPVDTEAPAADPTSGAPGEAASEEPAPGEAMTEEPASSAPGEAASEEYAPGEATTDEPASDAADDAVTDEPAGDVADGAGTDESDDAVADGAMADAFADPVGDPDDHASADTATDETDSDASSEPANGTQADDTAADEADATRTDDIGADMAPDDPASDDPGSDPLADPTPADASDVTSPATPDRPPGDPDSERTSDDLVAQVTGAADVPDGSTDVADTADADALPVVEAPGDPFLDDPPASDDAEPLAPPAEPDPDDAPPIDDVER